MRYVSLHHHSTFSYQDGYGLPEEHVARAADLGMEALALTEHGNVSSYVRLEKAANKEGIKPIFGLEAYTAPTDMRAAGNRRKWHLTLLAMNEVGYRNLMQLVSMSWAEGFYQWPTIHGEWLAEFNEGLIVMSGCSDSKLACDLLGGKGIESGSVQAARRTMDRFAALLGDRFYLEVQQFPELPRTHQINEWYAAESRRTGISLVATSDCHYPFPEDSKLQAILHTAGRGIQNVDTAESQWEYDIPLSPPTSDKAILRRLRATGLSAHDATAAIGATAEISGRCNVVLPKVERLRYPLPRETKNGEELIWQWLRMGWRFRWSRNRSMRDNKQKYIDRMKYEMELIESKDYIDYFLMLSDAVRWCKERGLPVGPARGSAAASLVCYLLRITEIDPLPFPSMLFERFIDVTRTDLPDVDLDFDDERRDELRQHMVELYGPECVANIGTFTKYRGKNSLDDVGRVYEVPPWEVKIIKDLLVERSGGDSRVDSTLEDTIEMFPQAKEIMERYPDLANAMRLEGNYKSMSVHAAGLVVSNTPLADNVAIYTREMNGERRSVLSVDKKDAEYMGLLKADFLGLKTMGMIRRCLEMIGMSLDALYNVDLNEPDVIDAFRRNDVVGVFQFGGGATKIVNGDVRPDNFLELCDINALSRPGPLHSGTTNDYINVKHGRAEPDHLHPVIDDLTAHTKFQIIYQEQILQILKEIGGLPWTHINQIRKIISLKEGVAAFDKLGRLDFIDGAHDRYEISERLAARIFNKLVTAGQYAFCMTGDTVLMKGGSNRHSNSQYITMKELYDLYKSHTKSWWDYHSPKIQQMDADGRIRPVKIDRMYDPVEQPILKVTTASGRVLRMSTTHQLLTSDGYMLAHQLCTGVNLVGMAGKSKPRKKRTQTYKSWDGMSGDGNPAWLDGRTQALAEAKEEVLCRSGNKCEFCGHSSTGKIHELEFAHVLSLDDVGGDYWKYHSALNIMHLCNSCHKEFDYLKGERRVARDTRDHSTALDEIVSIEPDGYELVYDLHMDSTNHNYIGNGIVQHNNSAHCVSYSMLAYWTMYLKVHHPQAFYAANLIKFKDDQYSLLRDAMRHGLSFLPPDLDRSGVTWAAEGSAIRGGFSQIDKIGIKIAENIVNDRETNGRFAGWDDLERISGIGGKTIERIKDVSESDDPYGVFRIDRILAKVRRAIDRGDLGLVPEPTHKGSEIPTDAENLRVVYVGIPYKRNPQDILEDERARTGEDIETIRARIKDAHLTKKMVLTCYDDTDTNVYVRFWRQSFPRFADAAWGLSLGHDVIVVAGVKKGGFGTGVHVRQMWVVDPDDL